MLRRSVGVSKRFELLVEQWFCRDTNSFLHLDELRGTLATCTDIKISSEWGYAPLPWSLSADGFAKLINPKLRAFECTQDVSADDVTLLVSTLAGLEELSLSCPELSSLDMFKTHLKQLKKLKLTNLASIPDDSTYTQLPTNLEALCLHAPIQTLDSLSNQECLRELNLDGCGMLNSVANVPAKNTIESLVVSNTGITGLEGLPSLPKLKDFDVSGCPLFTSIEHLGTQPSLEFLNVSRTPLHTFEGLSCSALRVLRASRCPALAEAIGLEGHPTLQQIDFSDSGLETLSHLRGCQHVMKMTIEGCTRLTELDRELFSAIGQTLHTFNMSKTPIASFEALSDSAIQTLVADQCDALQAPSMPFALPALRSVSMDHSGSIASISFLAASPLLEKVSLRGCKIPNEDLCTFADKENLQSLDLRFGSVSSLVHLAASGSQPRLAKLEELDLCQCRSLTTLDFPDIDVALPALKHLNVSYTALNALPPRLPRTLETLDINECKGMKHITGSAPGLKELKASCSGLITLEHVGKLFPELQKLRLDFCDGITTLTNMGPMAELIEIQGSMNLHDLGDVCLCVKLEKADFSYCAALKDVSAFSRLENLKNVNISQTSVTSIAALLSPAKPTLQVLDVSGAPISDVNEINLAKKAVTKFVY